MTENNAEAIISEEISKLTLKSDPNHNRKDIIEVLKKIKDLDVIEVAMYIDKIIEKTEYNKTTLNKIITELHKETKEKERIEKEEIEKQKREEKIKKREEQEIATKSQELQQQEIMDSLKTDWKIVSDELFQTAFNIDYKTTLYYFAERLMFENKFYTFKDNGEIIRYESKDGIYELQGDIFIATETKKRLGEKSLNFIVREVSDSIRRSTYIERVILDKQPKNLLPVGNGLLNLDILKLENYNPNYIFLNKIDVNYNPEAKCEKFEKFIQDTCKDEKGNRNENQEQALQEWDGYTLLNDNRYEKSALFFGPKGTGKSVKLKTHRKLLGEKNVTGIPMQYLESNNFAVARLFGKKANIFTDLPSNALNQTSKAKILASGDPLTAEKKGKDSFEFTPSVKCMYSCNNVPRVPPNSEPFFDRFLIFKFMINFRDSPNRILKYEEELCKELEGILIWCLKGLTRLTKNNKFTEHMSETEVKEFWLRHSDSVASFILDRIEKNLISEETKSVIYEAYIEYCRVKGYPEEEVNIFWRRFKESVECKEYNPTNTLNGFQYKAIRGVKLKPAIIPEADEDNKETEKNGQL